MYCSLSLQQKAVLVITCEMADFKMCISLHYICVRTDVSLPTVLFVKSL